MPLTYVCDICQNSSDSSQGWKIVRIVSGSVVNVPTPGTPVVEETFPDLYFDTVAHLNQWLTQAGLKG